MGTLTDKTKRPDDDILKAALGKTFQIWRGIRKEIEKEIFPLTEEWKYYGGKSGWNLKIFHKKRNLFFIAPYNNYFQIAFIFGDKAAAEIEKSNMPESIKEELKNAKKYTEGRGLRLVIKKKKDAEILPGLVKIKLNN